MELIATHSIHVFAPESHVRGSKSEVFFT